MSRSWWTSLAICTLQDPWSQFFPLLLRITGDLRGDRIEPNVQHEILEALYHAQGLMPFDQDLHWTRDAMHVAESVFWHSLAVFWSPPEWDSNLKQTG